MINSSYGIEAYRTRDLSISMQTSSGDKINFDFSNHSAMSMQGQNNKDGFKGEFSFSSMQSFQFSIETNGLDEQDKKEIAAFMEITQPYIDSFLEELQEDAPTSPINQIARDIAGAFEPMKLKDQNTQNYVKTNIVEMFDKSLRTLELPQKENKPESKEELLEKIYEESKKLLEKTLKAFDELNSTLYA